MQILDCLTASNVIARDAACETFLTFGPSFVVAVAIVASLAVATALSRVF